MKYNKRTLLILAFILVVLVLGGILWSSRANNLLSRAVDTVMNVGEEGADPKPAVESLDEIPSDMVADEMDKQALLQSLQQSLLQAENDPEKSLEIRRRIQLLKEQQTPETTVVNNSQE